MVTGYLAARLNARTISTGSRIRAATSRLVQVVRGRGKAVGCECAALAALIDWRTVEKLAA